MEPTFTTRWFFCAQTGIVVEPGQHRCAVCGLPMRQVVPRSQVLRTTFSDYDVLRIRNGQEVCPACEWYMASQELRRSGWWLTPTQARPVRRQEWFLLLQEHITQPPAENGYYLIKPGGLVGKHLALWASMSMAGNPVRRVQFDRTALDLTERWLEVAMAAHRLREYHSWREITNDSYAAWSVAERWENLTDFVRLREMVKPWLRTPHLALAQFVWTKEKNETD